MTLYGYSDSKLTRAVGGVAVSIAIGIVPNWLEFQRFEARALLSFVVRHLITTCAGPSHRLVGYKCYRRRNDHRLLDISPSECPSQRLYAISPSLRAA